jgi:hypothetical protein
MIKNGPDLLRHGVGVEIGVILVVEGCARQHHRQLAAVVGVVVPRRVVGVPGMKPVSRMRVV